MTRRQAIFGAALTLMVSGLLIRFVIPAWVFQPLGVCSGRACGYQVWSGIAGSCVTGSGIWTGAVMYVWHTRCHAPGCLRHGRHRTADQTFVLCRRHHPDIPDAGASLQQIHAAHHAAKRPRT